MTPTQLHAALNATNCPVAFDNLTRQLYATDASHYQIEPIAVAFPKDAKQANAVIQAAMQAGIPIIPRGAGTGLVGGAIGEGLVIDFSKHNREITDFDPERRTVRVGPGVVLDQLNKFLEPEGYRFGPDVATSSRATIGGMIANNSSGSHVPCYGTTADHVSELDICVGDGHILKVGPGQEAFPRQRELVENMALFNSLQIAEQFPSGLLKRWPGYALERAVHDPNNLVHILAGSEGTLGAIVSAELKVVPLPKHKGLALIFFNSIAEAMQATVELQRALQPAAIEHLDRVLLDQTKGQREFRSARDLLELDTLPCESILVLEFFEDIHGRFHQLDDLRYGSRRLFLDTHLEMSLVWALRKAGLSLLTGCPGDAKPVTCIEDAAVRPKDLPAYYGGLERLMKDLGLVASYYGHAASGLLHVRPVLNLRSPEDLKKFRVISDEVAALVRQFKGSLCGEHGVGIARTEYLKDQVGEEMYLLMRQIKKAFDPHNLFNPGKVIADGRYQIDSKFRTNATAPLKLPFTPMLGFVAKDHSFVGNLEQCNGCGGCRKEAPTMCPTFIATGDEIMSTRGRANAIRIALEHRGTKGDPLRTEEMEMALSNCIACKACTSECPSNVNMALLKAELQHARIRQSGLTLSQRVFSSVDFLGRLGCKFPRLANASLQWGFVRKLVNRYTGVSLERPLPEYTRERFDKWFAKRPPGKAARSRVILWDDTFVRYHDPHIGMAAVKLLEAAGFQVELAHRRKCCGRPAFSQGNLDEAARLGQHNLALLAADPDNTPILFLEPSCYSMFAEDYRELQLPDADSVAKRCFLLEDFLDEVLRLEPEALRFHPRPGAVAIHVHCHAKALTNPSYMHRLGARLPGRKVMYLDSGCCGMAGAFGMLESKYELSLKIAEPLMEKIKALPFGTAIVASGASCRHQIDFLATVRARHLVEVLADALETGP